MYVAERIAQQMPDVSLTLKVGTGQACCDAVRDSSCDVALTQGILPQACTDLQVPPPPPLPPRLHPFSIAQLPCTFWRKNIA